MSKRDDATRDRILEAAGSIFAEHGFHKATIRDICAQAEVNLAAANYHFQDKENLYTAAIRHAHDLAIVQVPLPEWSLDTPPERKLRDFIRTIMDRMLVMRQLPWQAKLMMREFLQPTGACQEIVEEYIRPHFQILLGILDEMVPSEMPEYQRHQLAFSVIGQCMFYKMNDPVIAMLVPEDQLRQHFDPRALSDHITDVTLAALGKGTFFGKVRPSVTPKKKAKDSTARKVPSRSGSK